MMDSPAVGGAIDRLFDDSECAGAIHVLRLSDRAEAALRADEVWLAASVIKVAIGLEFYAQVDDGEIDPSRRLNLSPDRRTPGPTGISMAHDSVDMSLRDLCKAMLAISDNAATDAVLDAVGIASVNERLTRLDCASTVLVESIGDSIDSLAVDLGFSNYAALLQAQAGDLGADVQRQAVDQKRIGQARILDATRATRTTARDMTRLLAAVWEDQAASPTACSNLRQAMAGQVTRRLAPAVPDGGGLAAKSGALFGRVRNEIGVITNLAGERYAIAVLTRSHRPFAGVAKIDHAMAEAVRLAIADR